MNKTVLMVLEKETKGTVRYQEMSDDGTEKDNPVLGTLYVKKAILDGARPPRLTVTISDE